MGQIRVNEVCRELEVKSKQVLDFLPQIGVTGKKSHSSLIDDVVADQVRRHFRSQKAIKKPEPQLLFGRAFFGQARIALPLRNQSDTNRETWPHRAQTAKSRKARILRKQLQLFRTGHISKAELILRLKSLFALSRGKELALQRLWERRDSGKMPERDWIVGVVKILRKRRAKSKKKLRKIAKIRLRSPFGREAARWSRVRVFAGGLPRT